MNDKRILSRLEASDNTPNVNFFGRDMIVVFARAPVAGEVKSRLAQHIGSNQAMRIYVGMLSDCLELAQTVATANNAEVLICYTPPDAFTDEFRKRQISLFDDWDGARHPQSSGDLADRLLACFSYLKNCGAEKIVIIGSDAPDIPADYLRGAFNLLNTHDLVLGPAEDGGFYLIGAREIAAPLFDNVAWSSTSTLATILDNARLDWSTALLDSWRDVDDIEDLRALAIRLLSGKSHAPHTKRALTLEKLLEG